MRKQGDKVVKQTKKKTPAKKKTPPKRKPKLPVKLTQANIDLVYNAVKYSGRIEAAVEILKVSRQSVYKWKKAYPIFGDTLSHAMAEHKKIIQTNQPQFFIKAVADVALLLDDRELKTTTIKRKRITPVIDDEDLDLEADSIEDKVPDGEKITMIEEDVTIKKYIREPTWAAIEKVLGKKQLRNIVYEHLHHRNKINGIGVVSKMFGSWMRSDELGNQWNGSLLNDVLDLMLVRTLQAEARSLYEDGQIDFDEYNRVILDTTKTFGYIAHNRESRALRLLEGKSFSEIMDGVQSQLQEIIDVLETVVNDVGIKRKQIPTEVVKRIRGNKGTQRYTVWSNYQDNLPASTKK